MRDAECLDGYPLGDTLWTLTAKHVALSDCDRVECVLDVEDMRRRCAAHDRWLRENPEFLEFSEAWADRNFEELRERFAGNDTIRLE